MALTFQSVQPRFRVQEEGGQAVLMLSLSFQEGFLQPPHNATLYIALGQTLVIGLHLTKWGRVLGHLDFCWAKYQKQWSNGY